MAEDVYCTLLLNDEYLPGARVLAHSLRDGGTTKKLAVMIVLADMKPETVTELKRLYDYVIPVDPIYNRSAANLLLMNRLDLNGAFTKINVWKQTQFRKVLYADADVVALRPPDELFNLDVEFAACPDIGWPDCFNSGVMLIRPDAGTYHALLELARRSVSFDGADQGLLNIFFKNWHRLSFNYNCTPSSSYQYTPAYRHYGSQIAMVHFIGAEKPWNSDRGQSYSGSPFGELLGRWWAVWDRHYRPRAESTPPSRNVPTLSWTGHGGGGTRNWGPIEGQSGGGRASEPQPGGFQQQSGSGFSSVAQEDLYHFRRIQHEISQNPSSYVAPRILYETPEFPSHTYQTDPAPAEPQGPPPSYEGGLRFFPQPPLAPIPPNTGANPIPHPTGGNQEEFTDHSHSTSFTHRHPMDMDPSRAIPSSGGFGSYFGGESSRQSLDFGSPYESKFVPIRSIQTNPQENPSNKRRPERQRIAPASPIDLQVPGSFGNQSNFSQSSFRPQSSTGDAGQRQQNYPGIPGIPESDGQPAQRIFPDIIWTPQGPVPEAQYFRTGADSYHVQEVTQFGKPVFNPIFVEQPSNQNVQQGSQAQGSRFTRPTNEEGSQAAVFAAPVHDWDPARSSPPPSSRPEASGLPHHHYRNEWDNLYDTALFVAPIPKPPPSGLSYHFSESSPELQDSESKPVFPWETKQRRATRIFADGMRFTENVPEEDEEDEEEDEFDSSSPQQDTWKMFASESKWDSVPGIQEYVSDLQRRRTHVPPSGERSTRGLEQYMIQGEDDDERPSLSITPNPIRRSRPHWLSEDNDTTFPSAPGIPSQEDWDPEAKLDELKRLPQTLTSYAKNGGTQTTKDEDDFDNSKGAFYRPTYYTPPSPDYFDHSTQTGIPRLQDRGTQWENADWQEDKGTQSPEITGRIAGDETTDEGSDMLPTSIASLSIGEQTEPEFQLS